MAAYVTEADAEAAGYTIEHHADRHEFVVVEADRVVGVAHYRLIGGQDGAIDFDHTMVIPRLRGTGLSEILARRAVTDEIVLGRHVRASCWFIEKFLAQHPDLRPGA
ncbi:GNAT family N-acetyltransferase [Leucobacter soli]|uniref:N-acetyltransferase domain-containing protein n=1 Tax=Leucobacter soli TaxID=2812850 RepID=A0A916K0W1_9MICO|nr:N-acetyltransferase [Leucobacter soli]CAG7612467.1 hypothetical protein LEUCIP111803_01569 [Leucobacter soli]